MNKLCSLGCITLIFMLLLMTEGSAHEPLFGLGPHTIYQYGFGLESELEKGEHGWANHVELLYGVTPNLAITGMVPYIFPEETGGSGFGDVALRSKYRFFRHDFRGGQSAFALHGGVKFATGERNKLRGSGTTDYFTGLSYGLESRRHYAFADVRYRVNGKAGNLNRGDMLNVDAAYGIRPWQLSYLQPDLVVLLELLGSFGGKNTIAGAKNPNSGGSTFSLAPGFLFSYRNVMLKGGVKFLAAENLNGNQEKPETEYVLGIEVHLPPFK